jgi:hypothetical protein
LEEAKKMKLKTLSIILTVLLVCQLNLVVFVHAQSTTFTISQGIYPSPFSFTIWREGNTFYAKNPYGVIQYSGTSGETVVNNAMNVLEATPYGGAIVFLKGLYPLNNLFWNETSGKQLVFIGEGKDLTILQSTTANPILTLDVGGGAPSGNVFIAYSLTFDGNNIGTRGINFVTSAPYGSAINLHEVALRQFTDNALTDKDSSGLGLMDSYFEEVEIASNTNAGVDVKAQHYTWVRTDFASNNIAYVLRDTNALTLIGCTFTSNDFDFKCTSGATIEYLTISGTWFENGDNPIVYVGALENAYFLSLSVTGGRIATTTQNVLDFVNIGGAIKFSNVYFGAPNNAVFDLGYLSNETYVKVELCRFGMSTFNITINGASTQYSGALTIPLNMTYTE